jgi:peptidoglycan/xylan/chitin deacetylase (PgdA/CDA1 family)
MRLRRMMRDWAAAVLYAAGLTRPARAAAGRAVIVTFHRVLPMAQIAEYPIPSIAITPEELGWFLEFFRRHFTCAPLREAMARQAAGESPAKPLLALTFDDGQLDNYQHARPVLAAHDMSASFFVVASAAENRLALWPDRMAYALKAALQRAPSAAGALAADLGTRAEKASDALGLIEQVITHLKKLDPQAIEHWIARAQALAGGPALPSWDGMMGWRELRELADSGHEIGSHSMTHTILPSLSDADLERETRGSREMLQAALGRAVESFCYPNGDHDERVVAAVERAGYRYAVSTRWGHNDRGTSLYRLRRCEIEGETSRTRAGALSPARLAWRLSGLHPGLG